MGKQASLTSPQMPHEFQSTDYSTYSAEQIKTLTLHSQLESSSIFTKVPQKGVCVSLRMHSKMLANSTIREQEFKRITQKIINTGPIYCTGL